MGSYVSWDAGDSWSSWGGVNEESNGDRIIFKHCKCKINSRHHNN